MAKNRLGLNDFLILWAQQVGGTATPKVARKYLDGLHKLLLQELKMNEGEMWIYNVGKFYLREKGGYDRLMGDPLNGGTTRRYVNLSYDVEFEPAKQLLREINEGGFVMGKPKASPRKKYNTDVERREAHNAPRRKPPKTIEALACDAINEAMERKKKKNG